jgi:SM-20-related protein
MDTAKFEKIISSILEDNYAVIDDFLPKKDILDLKNQLIAHLENDEFKQAGIGKGTFHSNNLKIRGDNIHWIENSTHLVSEKKYIKTLFSLISYLNKTCYTGLNDLEVHYAYYPTGTFYKKHLDSFVNDQSRKYSVILYLNEDWVESHAGELLLYLNNDKMVRIEPIAGRLVFFPSHEIPHEVTPTNKPRLSITGWLKK